MALNLHVYCPPDGREKQFALVPTNVHAAGGASPQACLVGARPVYEQGVPGFGECAKKKPGKSRA